ncbi:4'-phosphopantetheinyl transferase family protein [Psychroserpens ponticola]|uniref:4'-phosphopantetheinyl transferase superfamily protein n=1 Tax=Psychroserpens ponticola TaxID=2932268 RepID=A0ABY7RY19_9FLAO|nr:4'-phosphopantetheinyl transferase superfamily protein [Psychroserpens ponticola]WCO01768.1 4'-phosphopantetheinyl transferase superfamily protein [Psychroserpens ponticola]
MIGNDVVDLKQAAKDSNWKRPRFLDKVFTQKEQSIIFYSANKEQMVWLLWSMKEAAYKAFVREFKHCFFNPKLAECQLDLNNEGFVSINDNTYYLKSTITSEYVHSIASNTNEKFPKADLFKLYDNNLSDEVRSRLIHQVINGKDRDINSINIKKTVLGVPNVFLGNQQIFEALSISHHGKYAAFAIY